MQATITYLLTEQAQRAQMAATGQPVARKQTVTVEITTDIFRDGTAAGVLEIGADGSVTADLTYDRAIWGTKIAGPIDTPSLSSDPLDYLTRRIADVLCAHKAHEQECAVALEQLRELHRQFLAGEAPNVKPYRHGNIPALDHGIRYAPYYLPADDPLRAELDAWMTAREREQAAATRRKEADERAKEQAKTDAIAAWVREHGTDSQRARLADGLLPRKEVLTAMAEFAFAQAGVPEHWDYRVCDDRAHKCGAVAELTSLDEAAYERWVKIRATLPEGYTVTFWRVRECLLDGEDAETAEYRNPDEPTVAEPVTIASITIPFGPFAFERDVRLEESK